MVQCRWLKVFKHNMHFFPQEVNIYVAVIDILFAVFFKLGDVKSIYTE